MTMMANGQLPIHDSLIVRVGYVDELQQAMQDAFQAHVGGIANMKHDLIRTSDVFGWSESKVLDTMSIQGSGIVKPLEALGKVDVQSDSIMNRYLDSWKSIANQ